MKSYIQRQDKQVQERIDFKLDVRLVKTLVQYCQFLDSDRNYVVSQALEIAFRKDQEFGQWLASQNE